MQVVATVGLKAKTTSPRLRSSRPGARSVAGMRLSNRTPRQLHVRAFLLHFHVTTRTIFSTSNSSDTCNITSQT